MAASNRTSGLTSPLHLSIRLHIKSPVLSYTHHPLHSSHTAAARRLLLHLTPVPVWTLSGGSGSRNKRSKNKPPGPIALMSHQLPRCYGNGSRNKPSMKACKSERRRSGPKASLPRHMVTYTGTHRFLHFRTALSSQTKEVGSS